MTMANLNIESSADGFLIYDLNFDPDNNPQNNPFFNQAQMDGEVGNYWGVSQMEKIFTINFWKAEQLIAQSNLNQIALKVTNVNDPSTVNAEWISFNAETTAADNLNTGNRALKDAAGKIITILSNLVSSDSEDYFVLTVDAFNSLRNEVFSIGNTTVQTINAKIGKTSTDEIVVFFILGAIQLHLSGTGGESNACGVKIPPPNL